MPQELPVGLGGGGDDGGELADWVVAIDVAGADLDGAREVGWVCGDDECGGRFEIAARVRPRIGVVDLCLYHNAIGVTANKLHLDDRSRH